MTTRTTRALLAAALIAAGAQALAIDNPAPAQTRKSVDTRAALVAADMRPLQWAGWQAAYASGDRVGQTTAGGECRQGEAREWSELLARRVGAELQQAFDDELARAHLAPRSRQAAALQVSAVLNDLQLNLCSSGDGHWQGGFQVQVSWKVRQGARVVHQVRTKGSYVAVQTTDRPPAYALRDAFAKAARGLLADQRLMALLQPATVTVAARD